MTQPGALLSAIFRPIEAGVMPPAQPRAESTGENVWRVNHSGNRRVNQVKDRTVFLSSLRLPSMERL